MDVVIPLPTASTSTYLQATTDDRADIIIRGVDHLTFTGDRISALGRKIQCEARIKDSATVYLPGGFGRDFSGLMILKPPALSLFLVDRILLMVPSYVVEDIEARPEQARSSEFYDTGSTVKLESAAILKDTLLRAHNLRHHNRRYPASSFNPNFGILRRRVTCRIFNSQTPDNASSNVRVVFDVSTKASNGRSLSDTLLAGLKWLQHICSVLLKFRLYPVVFTADIRQMYRQILVSPVDRQFQRIVWRFLTDDALQEFVLNTVTYGTPSAPFLAIHILLQLTKDEQSGTNSIRPSATEHFYDLT
ncbi:hypothetical protein TcasGA2_TC001684 [Tribolium castaneum]|uniref:Reverse transcriptase domain-containing protein n=1 Tax=Tribolium castaneum TaxID=7070 RepID=D6W8G9_TRICA|nr:hypothetical protein TcasGA2_TC001684 [Tribolium castaneum]